MRIIVRPAASDEANAGGDWYAVNSGERRAAEFAQAVEDALDLIRENPRAGVLLDRDYRRVLVHRFPYGVIYRVDVDVVVVIAVAHTSRKPGYWRGRR